MKLQHRFRLFTAVIGHFSALLQSLAQAPEVAGVVVGVSDMDAAAQSPCPMARRSIQAQTAVDRVWLEALNLNGVAGGVRVECDDVNLGDAQHVVVVPRDYLKIVLKHLVPARLPTRRKRRVWHCVFARAGVAGAT